MSGEGEGQDGPPDVEEQGVRDADAAPAADVVVDSMSKQSKINKKKKKKKKKSTNNKPESKKQTPSVDPDDDSTRVTAEAKMARLSCIDAYFYITLCFNGILLYISTFCLIIGNQIESFWDTYSTEAGDENEVCYEEYGFSADTFLNVSIVVFVFTLIMTIVAIYRIRKLNTIKSEILSNDNIKENAKFRKYKARRRRLKITNISITVLYYITFVVAAGMSFILVSSLGTAASVFDSVAVNNEDCGNVDDSDVETITGTIDAMYIILSIAFVIGIVGTFKFWKGTPSEVFAAGCSYNYA